MNILPSSSNNYKKDPFSLTPLMINDYIPLYAFNTSLVMGNYSYYNKPEWRKDTKVESNTLKKIVHAFEISYKTVQILINGMTFYIAKGILMDSLGNVLMVCGMKREAYLDENIYNYEHAVQIAPRTFSYTNYVMFYSTELMTEARYAPLNRRLQSEILNSCYTKGIEVRILTSAVIEMNTFARVFRAKKMRSLGLLKEYMEGILPTYLYEDREDLPKVVEKVEEVPTELSLEEEALLFGVPDVDIQEVEEPQEDVHLQWLRQMERERFSQTEPDPIRLYASAEGHRAFEEAVQQEMHNIVGVPTERFGSDTPTYPGLTRQTLEVAIDTVFNQIPQVLPLPQYTIGIDPAFPDATPVVWRHISRTGEVVELTED